MWKRALRKMMGWTKETAVNEPDTKLPAAAGPDANTATREGLYEPRARTRPPTPEDFILDWSETDPLRRFRISPRPKIPRDIASRTNRFRPTE
jgi:hypothetical protein